MSTPLVSIITVNYNTPLVTRDLLRSLERVTYQNREVIVVDNGSTEGDLRQLKGEYPGVLFIESSKNLGFAGGNNLAIKEAKGELLLFINNDTEVEPSFLEPLVQLICSKEEIGMVSPKIKFHWDATLIQYAGFTNISRLTIRNKAVGFMEKDSDLYNQITETGSIHGAAFMVKRELINKIGLMSHHYFLYYEEHDWAERAKRYGYKLYYQPNSLVLHKESLTTGKESPLKTYYITRGRVIYAVRNRSGVARLVALLYLFTVALPRELLLLLLKGDWKNGKAHLRAYGWSLRHGFSKRLQDDNWN